MDLKAAAMATAAKFDVHEPGWAKKIDLDRLDMSSGQTCICAHLFGDFFATELPSYLAAPKYDWSNTSSRMRIEWAHEHGLNADPHLADGSYHNQSEELDGIWYDLVQQRLLVSA